MGLNWEIFASWEPFLNVTPWKRGSTTAIQGLEAGDAGGDSLGTALPKMDSRAKTAKRPRLMALLVFKPSSCLSNPALLRIPQRTGQIRTRSVTQKKCFTLESAVQRVCQPKSSQVEIL